MTESGVVYGSPIIEEENDDHKTQKNKNERPSVDADSRKRQRRYRRYYCRHEGCSRIAIFKNRNCYRHGTTEDRKIRNERLKNYRKKKSILAVDRARKRLKRIFESTSSKKCLELIGIPQNNFLIDIVSMLKKGVSISDYLKKWKFGFKKSPAILYSDDDPYRGFRFHNLKIVYLTK